MAMVNTTLKNILNLNIESTESIVNNSFLHLIIYQNLIVTSVKGFIFLKNSHFFLSKKGLIYIDIWN